MPGRFTSDGLKPSDEFWYAGHSPTGDVIFRHMPRTKLGWRRPACLDGDERSARPLDVTMALRKTMALAPQGQRLPGVLGLGCLVYASAIPRVASFLSLDWSYLFHEAHPQAPGC